MYMCVLCVRVLCVCLSVCLSVCVCVCYMSTCVLCVCAHDI